MAYRRCGRAKPHTSVTASRAPARRTGWPRWRGSGIDKLIHGDGVMDKVTGGLEVVSGGVGTAGLAGAGLTSAGATGAGGALTSLSAAAAPAGAVAGAGALGLGLGKMGNDFTSRHGGLGKNEDGSNRNWSNLAAHWGNEVRDAVGHGWVGDFAGGLATFGGSLVGAGGAAVTGVLGAGEAVYDLFAGGEAPMDLYRKLQKEKQMKKAGADNLNNINHLTATIRGIDGRQTPSSDPSVQEDLVRRLFKHYGE